jgi:uncharacterized protein YjbI with pentapeptide repeats
MEEHPESGEVNMVQEFETDMDVEPLAVIEGVNFVGAVFSQEQFAGVKFVGCQFEDCDFTGMSIGEADEDDASEAGVDREEWVRRVRDFDLEEWAEEDPSPELWTWFLDCRMNTCRFEDATLSNVFFDGGSIQSSFFVRADLYNVLFRDIDLIDTEIGDSDVTFGGVCGGTIMGCRFPQAVFSYFLMESTTLRQSRFVRSTLKDVGLYSVTFDGVAFERCLTQRVHGNGSRSADSARLPDFLAAVDEENDRFVDGIALEQGVRFESMTILDGDFSHADLRGATFSGCTLLNCNFTGADLTPADEDALDPSGRKLVAPGLKSKPAEFLNSTMSGCTFERASLEGVRFQDARVTGCSFLDADLSQGNLQSVELVACNLSGTDLGATSFEGCSLQDVWFREVEAEGVGFKRSSLVRCDFDKANLRGAALSKSTFSESSFVRAATASMYVVETTYSDEDGKGYPSSFKPLR